ncbi:MAG: PilN domain-containing protein [Candidatus Eisenbacteria sp.]|nr:PilN domain-containing protein [Candidatus Eisenbacteria bacterium]
MYDINFIGQRIVPESRKKIVTAIVAFSALSLGLTLASMGAVSVSDLRMADVYAAEIIELREHFTVQYPGIPDEDELETIIGKTKPHLKDLAKIVDARICFTPIWESIARAVPDGVWLTRVSIADLRDAEEGARGKPRSFRGIIIEGVALAGRGPEGDQAISAFVENLEDDEGLQSIIQSVESLGTGLEQIRGTSVVGFEITCPF